MVIITGNDLSLIDFMKVVRENEQVSLSEDAIVRINKSNQWIKSIVAKNETVYGINTGFGKMSDVIISKDNLEALQIKLLKSHACGVGKHFPEEAVRGLMLLRINALAKGYSGIRLTVLEQIMDYLNYHIIPVIPEQGSLGASGDLAQLSHMGLTLVGLGEVYYKKQIMATKDALSLVGLKPLPNLEAKEGLSLINGTQAMMAIGAIALYDAINLAKLADIASALTLEALLGVKDAFDDLIHQVRGQQGQIKVASNIRKLCEESTYLTTQGQIRVQDAYSLRCISQVHGASRDALAYIKEKVEIEMNAATDNPLIFGEDKVISGGNFHGQPVALPFDFLKIALCELGSISERRIERLVNPQLNGGLPAFLASKPGLNSGFMIVQYSAASLVSENKILSHPASVDSIPSSANQEDHVSMGTTAARGATTILENVSKIIAMELLTACQALDFRAKKQLGKGTRLAYDWVRKEIHFVTEDEIMYYLLNKAFEITRGEVLIKQIEQLIGQL
ncbi:MAG: histidine ammonia-lyase [Bacilli bacterium]